MDADDTHRVLSIQSHVVSGYVGNKAATFPLQVLGFEVDAINSVQFSNHTGYKSFHGQVLNSNDLSDIIKGLVENGLHKKYTHLLTGYVGSPSFLKEIKQVAEILRKSNPNLIFLCDPVMGDNGKFYVPETLLPIYRDEVIQLADVITPNQFELELLSGLKITCEIDARKAINVMHDKGINTVIMTSCSLGEEGKFTLYASHKIADEICCYKMTALKFDAVFTGTGDLFSAIMLAWYSKHPDDLKASLEKTINTIQSILRTTLEHAKKLAGNSTPDAEQMELRLVQSIKDLTNPCGILEAVKL